MSRDWGHLAAPGTLPVAAPSKDPITKMWPVCGPRFRLGTLRRSHVLYLGRNHGAGDGNRTHIASLEGFGSGDAG